MSCNLRVLAPEELELVAGGSMDPWNWDPSYMQSSYSFSTVPVFGATSWTTSSFGSNYAAYSAAALAGGFASTNAYLQHNAFYGGANAAGEGSVIIMDGTTASLSNVYIAENHPSEGFEDGDIVVTGDRQLISYDGTWLSLGTLTSVLGAAYVDFLNQNGGSPSDPDAQYMYNDPEHELDIDGFYLNKAELASDLRLHSNVTLSAQITVGTQVIDVDINLGILATFVENYGFYFNSSHTTSTASGASFDTFAVLDPLYLTNASESTSASWNWATLHEVAHQMLGDVSYALHAQWYDNDRLAGVSWANSSQFQLGEAYADALVSQLAAVAGFPVDSNVNPAWQLPTNPFSP